MLLLVIKEEEKMLNGTNYVLLNTPAEPTNEKDLYSQTIIILVAVWSSGFVTKKYMR